MSALLSTVSYGQLIERVKKYISNNWPDITADYTSNECALYCYEAIGEVMVQQANEHYKTEGLYPTNEGFITKYSFAASTFTYDMSQLEYNLTLPLPPINLPLGISVKSPYFTGPGLGRSYPGFAINAFQMGYGLKLPTPDIGWFYEIDGNAMTINMRQVDLINSGWTLYVPMMSPRSKNGDDDDLIQLPDDAMSMVFDLVTAKLVNRVNRPRTQANTGAPRFTEQP